MPSIQDLYDQVEARLQRQSDRKAARKEHAHLLPPDFTGAVFNAAREEAARITAWLEKVEAEIERLKGEISREERAVRAACPRIVKPARVRGDILAGYEVVSGEPTSARVKTAEAVKLQQERVAPLRRRREALERERFAREQELAQLRKLAQMASRGDVALIHHLSDKWRSRLEIGSVAVGKLPPVARQMMDRNAIYVDAAGVPLPPEALDASGKPDVPAGGRVEK